MAFVPAPNIVMVEVRCTLEGQLIENRFMIDALGPVTPTNLASITNLVSVWAQAQYFDWIPSAVTLREVVGTDMSAQNSIQHTIVPAGTVPGAVGGLAMPNETTICVSLRSGVRGRSARGRAFVLALPKDAVSGNNLSAVWVDGLTSSFQILIDTLAGAGSPMVIVSYINNKAPRVGGPVYFQVLTALIVDSIVDSMRKRKPGVGT